MTQSRLAAPPQADRGMKLKTILALRCPVCERGKIFKGYFDTPERCPDCGYFFMRESGYFLPHVPIGYGATAAVALGTWPLLRYVFGVRILKASQNP